MTQAWVVMPVEGVVAVAVFATHEEAMAFVRLRGPFSFAIDGPIPFGPAAMVTP